MNYLEIKNLLMSLSDPVEKLELVMDFGKKLKPVPDTAKCVEISGCMSLVKICFEDDKFYGWADSVLVRGIVSIILLMIDGKTIEQIKEMNMYDEFMNLNLELGAGRLNGINSILGFFRSL